MKKPGQWPGFMGIDNVVIGCFQGANSLATS